MNELFWLSVLHCQSGVIMVDKIQTQPVAFLINLFQRSESFIGYVLSSYLQEVERRIEELTDPYVVGQGVFLSVLTGFAIIIVPILLFFALCFRNARSYAPAKEKL